MSKPAPVPGIAANAPLRFSARLFAAVAHFQAVKDIRYYLCGVRWEPHPKGGALLMATDGHRLAIAFDVEGRVDRPQTTVTSPGLCVAARRASTIACIGERLVCLDNIGREIFVQPGSRELEGSWPDIGRVLPDPGTLRQTIASTFNARYIADLGIAAKLMRTGMRVDGLSFWQCEGADADSSPTVARYDSEPNFAVVTMPMRANHPFGGLEFFEAVRVKQKAAKPEVEAVA
jgi:hypothetical protein